jgi:hypothetical protein
MSTHHVWRPRMDRDPTSEPICPVTQRSPTFDRVELAETEREEGEGPLDPAIEPTRDQWPATTPPEKE